MRFVKFRELALKPVEPVMIDNDTGEVTSTLLVDRIVQVVGANSYTKVLTVELGGPLDSYCPPEQVGKTRELRPGEWSTYYGDHPRETRTPRHIIQGHKVLKR